MSVVNLDLPSNSIASKENEPEKAPNKKKIEAVAKGQHKKEPKNRFIAKTLRVLSGENLEKAGESVIDTIILPALGDLVIEALHGLIDKIFEDVGSGPVSRGKSSSNSNYTPYQSVSKGKTERRRKAKRRGDRVETIIFDTRKDADTVLYQLRQILEQDDQVSAEDYCISCGIDTDDDYMNAEWGWEDLSEARVKHTIDGKYYIDLPRVIELHE